MGLMDRGGSLAADDLQEKLEHVEHMLSRSASGPLLARGAAAAAARPLRNPLAAARTSSEPCEAPGLIPAYRGLTSGGPAATAGALTSHHHLSHHHGGTGLRQGELASLLGSPALEGLLSPGTASQLNAVFNNHDHMSGELTTAVASKYCPVAGMEQVTLGKRCGLEKSTEPDFSTALICQTTGRKQAILGRCSSLKRSNELSLRHCNGSSENIYAKYQAEQLDRLMQAKASTFN